MSLTEHCSLQSFTWNNLERPGDHTLSICHGRTVEQWFVRLPWREKVVRSSPVGSQTVSLEFLCCQVQVWLNVHSEFTVGVNVSVNGWTFYCVKKKKMNQHFWVSGLMWWESKPKPLARQRMTEWVCGLVELWSRTDITDLGLLLDPFITVLLLKPSLWQSASEDEIQKLLLWQFGCFCF